RRAEKSERFSLDVRGFSPEELTVKMDGRKLTVCGTHDARSESEDGCLSHEHREVRREVLLPEDVNLEAVACALSQDGRLCIEAPRLSLPSAEERTIPITITRAQEAVAEGTRRPAGEEADAGGEQ
uniref:SHSP domain-containing protein n=1 Tax=Varanus komodoensis TaxID=61221 RepID=A0A8D2Q889_VARKO